MVAILVIFIFYSINVIIASYSSLISFYKQSGLINALNLFWAFFIGFKEKISFSSFISVLIISFLIGILFALILYKTSMIKSTSTKSFGVLGTTGIFLGIIAPGCAACGIGLLSVLGLGTAALTFLPFKGLEFSILAIGILSVLLFKITKDINEGLVCKVDFKKK